jgi:hypothetical protein
MAQGVPPHLANIPKRVTPSQRYDDANIQRVFLMRNFQSVEKAKKNSKVISKGSSN